MKKQSSRDVAALHSLERWRTAQLDSAQAMHAQRRQVVSERTDAVAKVQSTIDDSQDMARTQLEQNRILSVDSLTRIRHFTSAQVEKLQLANVSLAESEQAASEAHTAVCRKFEELSAVERLRLRREQEAAKEAARHEQKRLDDQAMLRSATQRAADIHARSKTN